ncbi:MAG: hypothetical protein V4654_09430 [Bdellovibrionota bacterium]
MKKMILVLLALGLISSIVRANTCQPKSIKVDSDNVELIRVVAKPEQTLTGQTIPGNLEVLVSGIYMFVRNGQTWNIYRCADEANKLNLNKCVIKNDFEFGNLVKRYGTSGITVRKTDSNRLEVRLNVAGNEELDYYDVRASEKGMEVIQNKYTENKVQRHLSHHAQVSLGICSTPESTSSDKKSTGSTSQSKKVKTSQ